jgi:hypothetical protein
MLSTVINRVLRIRMVPQMGVMTRSPVKKYRRKEALTDFDVSTIENDTSFLPMPQAVS